MVERQSVVTDRYALYLGDCIDVMAELPPGCVDLSIYSPPFCGLYNYSSSERDLSNCRSYDEFFEHYAFVVEHLARLTKPGRTTAVHCMDVPRSGANIGGIIDFPGDIIRLHERLGFEYWSRRVIWKEPLAVRNRTMAKGLAHQQIVEDASCTTVAGADFLLQFRKRGENRVPVDHPRGLAVYAGGRAIPRELLGYRGWEGKQTENRYSHWIWRQYASSVWDDVRVDNVLPYEESRDVDDEKHVHPLQLDVIDRACVLWSNEGESVLTPFAGVGSEVYGAVLNGRRGIGVELKPSYFAQSVRNLATAKPRAHQEGLFSEEATA
jgi:DNA modification methylase